METTSSGSIRIFRNEYHYRTSYYNEKRTSSIHKGTDYGTSSKNLPQYIPLDKAVVKQIVTKETNGDARGCRVRVEWKNLNLGLIMQHLEEGSIPNFYVGQILQKNTFIGRTGMTGKYANGKRVSTGIHAHFEVYYINQSPYAPNNLSTFNFESLDFEDIENKYYKEEKELTENEVKELCKKIIKEEILGSGLLPEWAAKTGEWDEAIKKGIVADKGVNPTEKTSKVEVAGMILRAMKE